MDREELDEILRKHKLWLAEDYHSGKRADLQHVDLHGADLCDYDLRHADLRDADLRDIDLRRAAMQGVLLCRSDLRGSLLDFSCWPLSCGSFRVVADERLVFQLLCHVARLDVSKLPESSKGRKAVEEIRRRGWGDWFCKHRNDIEPIKEVDGE